MARYTEDFKNALIELYKSGKSLAVLHSEYSIPKSTISTWIKDNSPVSSISEDEMTLKILENYLKLRKRMKYKKKLWPYLQRSRIYC